MFLGNGGNVNDPHGDAVETLGAPIDPGPFKGLSMNCRACHFVDDVLSSPHGDMRAYADFARRSPIPARTDGKTHAARNSPPLVNSTLDRPGGLFSRRRRVQFDGRAGRFNLYRPEAWLATGGRAQAIAHIATVIRKDDGSFDLTDTGLSYRTLFVGTDSTIPGELRLLPQFRAPIGSASDQEIFDAVIRVVAAYVNGLFFSQTTEDGAPIRSPFDVFLAINGLPNSPTRTSLRYPIAGLSGH